MKFNEQSDAAGACVDICTLEVASMSICKRAVDSIELCDASKHSSHCVGSPTISRKTAAACGHAQVMNYASMTAACMHEPLAHCAL